MSRWVEGAEFCRPGSALEGLCSSSVRISSRAGGADFQVPTKRQLGGRRALLFWEKDDSGVLRRLTRSWVLRGVFGMLQL